MSDAIDRYDLHQDGDCDCALVSHPQGDWVRYESHRERLEGAAASQRRADLALVNLRTQVRDLCHGIKSAVAYMHDGQRERGEEVMDAALERMVAELMKGTDQ